MKHVQRIQLNSSPAFASISTPFKTPRYWGKEFHLNVCHHLRDSLLFPQFHFLQIMTMATKMREVSVSKENSAEKFKLATLSPLVGFG